MRRLARAVTVGLVAAACTTATADTTTTITLEPATSITEATTTTTETTTTTTTEAESVDICPRGTVWEPETTYSAECFIVPVAFEPVDEGWRSLRANVDLVWGIWVEPGVTSPAAHFIVLAYMPLERPETVVESIMAMDGVNPTSAPSAVEMGGGVSATVMDLVTDPVELTDEQVLQDECSTSSDAVGSRLGEPVYPLMFTDVSPPGAWGFGACRPFRVWVLEVADAALTVIWTPDDPDRFGELVPVAERLIDSMTFEAS